MVAADPTAPAPIASRLAARRAAAPAPGAAAAPPSLPAIVAALASCCRCDLYRNATQPVPGWGAAGAALMLVGEQPGDAEDLRGRPFVGPAGLTLNNALEAAGIDRDRCYVTNAVKHFKHELRGKRRIHRTPDASETKACRWWLDAELRLVKPKVVVALGGTAATAVLGRPVQVLRERGPAGRLDDGAQVFITVHPSYLLRIPEPRAKEVALAAFILDLRNAARAAETVVAERPRR
jgi:DNA polymerase